MLGPEWARLKRKPVVCMKKLLIAVFLLLMLLPAAAEEIRQDPWTLENGILTIYEEMDDFPDAAAFPWYGSREDITEIILAEGITHVSSYAFSGCSSLTAVSLPGSLVRIQRESFSGCSSLTSISIPESVSEIWYGAFYQCSSLYSVSFPRELLNRTDFFPEYVFYQTPWIAQHPEYLFTIEKGVLVRYNGTEKHVVIPEGVTGIGSYAFEDGPVSITLPFSVVSVGTYAFSACSSLTDVYYLGTLEQRPGILIDQFNNPLENAVWHYKGEASLTLPAGLTEIREAAFAGIAASVIVIPAGTERIESRAFADCTELTELIFEGSPLEIAPDILSGCGQVRIRCSSDSYAAQWAAKYGYSCLVK